MIKYKNINSIECLKKQIKENHNDFFISLNYGLRSSKKIYLTEDNQFHIINEIDDTEQILNETQLNDKSLTNIGYAIDNNAFWCEIEL